MYRQLFLWLGVPLHCAPSLTHNMLVLQPDRHLPGADTPVESPHIVIVESTYGVASHSAREEREQRFVQMVSQTRQAKCLSLPPSALYMACVFHVSAIHPLPYAPTAVLLCQFRAVHG